MMSLATMDDIVIIPPPPQPARALAAMSIVILLAKPHSSVPVVKRNIAMRDA